MNNNTHEILLYASNLTLGENIRVTCPACGGGNSKESSLSITLCEDGVLKWQCFRDKCTLQTGSTSHQHRSNPSGSQVVKKVRKKFEGSTEPLRQRDRDWITVNWSITKPPFWYYTSDYGGRIAMSVRSPKFVHRGWVLRDIKGTARTKALTYIDEGEQGLCWYKGHPYAPTVIVEDIPSAVRASKYVNAVALLGTGVGIDRAIEIGEYATRPIIICLDQDATAESFKMAYRHALLWGDVEIRPLKQDLKDMKETDLCKMLS